MEPANSKIPSVVRGFVEPVRSHYVDFAGRASRQSFWQFTMVYFSLALAISSIEAFLGTVFISVMSSFTLMLPSLAITARRLHDTGLSGWWQLIGFIPMIGIFILMVLLARRGNEGPNQFGEPQSSAMTTHSIFNVSPRVM